VNDGLDDSTPAILASYGKRIRVISKINEALGTAQNSGVATPGGKYLAFLDSDDMWLSRELAAMVGVLDQNRQAGLACGRTRTNQAVLDQTGFPVWPDMLKANPRVS
jgi:glycosyltransferase involved in cell wall biosynthesis